MYTTYAIEKIASSYRAERQAEAEQGRIARAVRRPRWQRTPEVPDVRTTAPSPVPVRVPRQRRWIDALVPSGR